MAKSRDKAAPDAADQEDLPRDEQIRRKMRDLTATLLRGEQIDPRGVQDVVRTMSGGAERAAGGTSAEARQELLDSLRELEEQLGRSADAARASLAQIAAKGMDFTDNDLKEIHARLSELQNAYLETVNRVASAASGDLQRELVRLAGQTQRVGADAGARTASAMAELMNRFSEVSQRSAATGIDATRDYGARMSLLASGFLAGIADALGEQRAAGRKEE